MRVSAVTSFLVLCLGLGYSFRISEFVEPLIEGRQDDVGDQIVPVFTVAFLATVFNNILMSFQPG